MSEQAFHAPGGDVVAFTGHRPDKLGGYGPSKLQNAVREAVRNALLAEPPSICAVSGMAQGLDQWAAEICIDLRIPFTAAVPCDDQDRFWPPAARAHYQVLLSKAARIVHVPGGAYAAWKMQRRNEWMVDQCGCLIAVWDGSPGGTANCVRYAERKDLCSVVRIEDRKSVV